MSRFLSGLGTGRRVLLVAATPMEARAAAAGLHADGGVLEASEGRWVAHEVTDRVDLCVCGVGKVNAAAATAALANPGRHAAVVSIGIAGALPGSGLNIGDVVAASACVYADEGLLTPAGFQDCATVGFGLGPWSNQGAVGGSVIPVSELLLGWMGLLTPRLVRIATVSTCSGTDALAAEVVRRTGAAAEGMEGAAVAHVAARLGVPAGELRAISNTTGDRDQQRWDLRAALQALEQAVGRV